MNLDAEAYPAGPTEWAPIDVACPTLSYPATSAVYDSRLSCLILESAPFGDGAMRGFQLPLRSVAIPGDPSPEVVSGAFVRGLRPPQMEQQS